VTGRGGGAAGLGDDPARLIAFAAWIVDAIGFAAAGLMPWADSYEPSSLTLILVGPLVTERSRQPSRSGAAGPIRVGQGGAWGSTRPWCGLLGVTRLPRLGPPTMLFALLYKRTEDRAGRQKWPRRSTFALGLSTGPEILGVTPKSFGPQDGRGSLGGPLRRATPRRRFFAR